MENNISPGNWTKYVQDFVKDKEVANYIVGGGDPAKGCEKDFTATYRCGSLSNEYNINIPGEAEGKSALFDCTNANNACSDLRLTLGDDGNLVLTDMKNSRIWSSNTSKTGLAMDEFKAANGKYSRNYLLVGETLSLGEFIGSPSGNCYLIMAQGPNGENGLQLNFIVDNCNEQNFGNDENTNGLFSMAKSAYNELIGTQRKVGKTLTNLNKTMMEEDKLYMNNTQQMNADINTYMGLNEVKPVLKKQVNQLEAMNEESMLYLTRYKYRRIAWLVAAILVILGSIKLARRTNAMN